MDTPKKKHYKGVVVDNPGLCVCCSQNSNNVKNAYIINQAGSYCSLKPLRSGMGEVVPARTSLTLSPIPSHYAVIIVSKCPSAAIVATSTVRVKVISPRKAFHQIWESS